MYPSAFDYYRAESVEEAFELLDEHAGTEVELLAGGHSLLPTIKSGLASPEVLIDIGQIDDLNEIQHDGDSVTIGANVNYATIASRDDLWDDVTVVAEAAKEIGDVQVRNRGTIGGNLAHSDPASDLPAAVLASSATIHAQSPDGSREIDADNFFLGMYATSLDEGEILTAVEVPTLAENEVGVYVKKPSPSSGYAMIGVAVVLETDGDTIESARVAANGAFDHAMRLDAVEDRLTGATVGDDTADEAAELATDGVEEWMFMTDLQASAEFRAQLLKVYTQRALTKAFEDAA
ncbi:MAG: FAD binding domain-containing protein [Halobacteriota archaeon]